MQLFSAKDLLNLWERGAGLHAVNQALLVLSYALPEHTYEYLAMLPLGKRDGHLFEVQRQNFSDRLDAYTECPECHERLEFSLSCDVFKHGAAVDEVTTKTVTIQGTNFNLRCPNSFDTAAAASSENVEAAKRTLLSRCVFGLDGANLDIDALPQSIQTAIAAELAAIDPQAEMLLDLACPSCGHTWQIVFDILPFLWTQIRARARRLFREVDALARTYGWSENDILGMSEARRSLYVQMTVS